MATVYQKKENGKLKSPYYYAKWKLANGKYAHKTTGLTKKREAQNLAKEWEVEQNKLRKKQPDKGAEVQDLVDSYVKDQNKNGFKPEAAINLIAEIYAIGSGKELKIPTLKRYLAEWLIDKKAHVAPSTYQSYKEAIASIARVYGGIGDKKIAIVEEDDLKQIQRKLLAEAKSKGTTMRTLNYKMGVLIRTIKDARISKLVTDEIWAGIEPMPEQDSKLKVPFTMEEIQRLMRSATGEWKGMILIGAQTGLRISNLINLKWSNIDIEKRVIRLKMVKQRITIKKKETKILSFPINESMMNCLNFLGEKKRGFVFPEVAKTHKDSRTKMFDRIMKSAKVDKKIYLEDYEEDGHRSFNSLRHYFNSACTNNDINKDVRKKYSGHSTDAANDIYAKQDPEVMRKELEKLPEIKWETTQ